MNRLSYRMKKSGRKMGFGWITGLTTLGFPVGWTQDQAGIGFLKGI
jgi:hypothetical protein